MAVTRPLDLDAYFPIIYTPPRDSLYFDYLRPDRQIKKVPKTQEDITSLEHPPILRFPKTNYCLMRRGRILNLSGGIAYQKPLKYFLSKGMMLTGNDIESICLADNQKLTPKHVLKVISSCPNVKYLDISNTNLKADCFAGRVLPRVEELSIAGYDLRDLELILRSFPNLQALNIVRDTHLSLVDFITFLDRHPNIEFIKIQDSYITAKDSNYKKADKEDCLNETFFDQIFIFD